MKRLLPRSIAAQTILVMVIGLTLSHGISTIIFAGDRGEALWLAGGQSFARRIADIAHLVGEAPPAWRERIVGTLNDQTFSVSLSPESMLVSSDDLGWRAEMIRRSVESRLSRDSVRRVLVQVLDLDQAAPFQGPVGFGPQMGVHMIEQMGAPMMDMMRGRPASVSFRVSVELADGQWINFASANPEAESFWSSTSVLSLASMLAAVVLLSIWIVGRLTRPLAAFAEAAQRFGRQIDVPPMPEAGPTEVRRAVRAFNEMQKRLQRLIESRTRMSAAISHDLRTPITRLRLRAELVEDEEQRTRMLATLDGMEQMIAATLAFAREDALGEATRTVDLAALAQSICDDMADAGGRVSLVAPERLRYSCRPTAIKRALTNVVDNAFKYGGVARVHLEESAAEIIVTVEDDGPGIPADQLDRVFAPFYRVEPSRNPETGGIGLGLSVVQSIVEAHGGDITLANRPGSGLVATLRLPK